MSDQRHWQAYDTFKLVIAAVLVIILMLLFFRPSPQVEISPTPLILRPTEVSTKTLTRTGTSTMTLTAVPTGTLTPTLTASSTWTPPPTATMAASFTPSATFTPTLTPTRDICSLALKSRLALGKIALVKTNLNFRVAPGLDQRLILANLVNTRLEIIGGPVCTPYLNSAYMWWEVRRPDGSTGWSAEGSATGNYYFLEPVD